MGNEKTKPEELTKPIDIAKYISNIAVGDDETVDKDTVMALIMAAIGMFIKNNSILY